MIKKSVLENEYTQKGKSVAEIAGDLGCSQNKVTYWLHKHGVKKRSISEAIYQKNNPDGDPFKKQSISSEQQWFLYGLGLGLYWGEGTKRNRHAVRLGNSDPGLIKYFLRFLYEMYDIQSDKLRYGIQLFDDVDPDEALQYWSRELSVSESAFYKVTITKSNRKGTYKIKSRYGVLTIYFHNKKLRDIIVDAIKVLQAGDMPT